MEEKEMKAFSLMNFLFITGISSLGFTGMMKFLDGETIRFFLYVGLGCLGLSAFALVCRLFTRKWDDHKSPAGAQENQLV